MITFLSQTLRVIPAGAGEAETVISMNGQTDELAFLAFMLGMKQFTLGVSKMYSTKK